MPATAAPPPAPVKDREADRLLSRLNGVRLRFRF